MKRYLVTCTKVDGGAFTVGYNRRKDAIASAALAAFGCGGIDGQIAALNAFAEIKRADCQRISYQPSLKQWCVTIHKH